MTSEATNASPNSKDQKHQADVDRITKELQSNSDNPVPLLLSRARAEFALGQQLEVQKDLAQAAELVKKEYKSEENVKAVENAFRELSISDTNPSEPTHESITKLIDTIGIFENNLEETTKAAYELAKTVQLDCEHVLRLLDVFHSVCNNTDREKYKGLAQTIAQTIKSTLIKYEKAQIDLLLAFVRKTASSWSEHASDGGFKQFACKVGAEMYASGAYALSKHVESNDQDGKKIVLTQVYSFYMSQIWLIGSLSSANNDEFKAVSHGLLRLFTASKPLAIYLFITMSKATANVTPLERLLCVLGECTDTKKTAALLIINQLLSIARDPSNSSEFPGFEKTPSQSTHSTPLAIVELRKRAIAILDGWIQSTIQSERARGLNSIASLFEAGTGTDLTADIWNKEGWIEELWDQGEFDKPETQMALLRMANESSSDPKICARMKPQGSGLVQALMRKSSNKELSDLASIVLSKWTGASDTLRRDNPTSSNAAADETPGPDAGIKDTTPAELADHHILRISDLSDDAVVEKATEALGYLCLKPEIKQRVAENKQFLERLFSLAQKTNSASVRFNTVMLIRNLVLFKPPLSEEQKRIQQLQKLGSKAEKRTSGEHKTVGDDLKEIENEEDTKLESFDSVSKRGTLLCEAGCIPILVLSAQSKSLSENMKEAIVDILVALATTPRQRGLIVQKGGVKALLKLSSGQHPKTKKNELPRPYTQERDKKIAFGLAKIAISVAPHIAFGNDTFGIAWLLVPLLAEENDPQANLMRFEALLALTNLASSPLGSNYDVRSYIADDMNAIGLVELLLLNDNTLVRRAATELLCNLVYNQGVFERYTRDADKLVPKEDEESGIVELDDSDEPANRYRSHKLHLLIALADVDDAPTRSAASGALAILSNDPTCCQFIFLAHPRAPDVILSLAKDAGSDQAGIGFKHRVAVIWANAARCRDARVVEKLAKNAEVVDLLRVMAGEKNTPYCSVAEETLRLLQG